MWTYRNKRKLTLSLLLVTISLLACNRGGGDKEEPETSSSGYELTESSTEAEEINTSMWQVEILEKEVVDELNTVTEVTQYDKSVMKVPYQNVPSDGNVYLLLNMKISKKEAGNSSFSWDNVSIVGENGSSFERLDDVFLTDHGYKRMGGTDIKIGENTGWICFEISKEASAQSLKFLYKSADGNIEITID